MTLEIALKELPLKRKQAFETQEISQDDFQEFLQTIRDLKKAIRVEEKQIKKQEKFNSAKKYKNIMIKKNEQNVLFVFGNTILDMNDENQQAVDIQTLKQEINNHNLIVTFSRETSLQELTDLGIEDANKKNRKYTSIHHLYRVETNFELKPIEDYLELLNIDHQGEFLKDVRAIYLKLLSSKLYNVEEKEVVDAAKGEAILQ